MPDTYIIQANRYGCLSFLFDVFATCITSGVWLIWIIIRQARARKH